MRDRSGTSKPGRFKEIAFSGAAIIVSLVAVGVSLVLVFGIVLNSGPQGFEVVGPPPTRFATGVALVVGLIPLVISALLSLRIQKREGSGPFLAVSILLAYVMLTLGAGFVLFLSVKAWTAEAYNSPPPQVAELLSCQLGANGREVEVVVRFTNQSSMALPAGVQSASVAVETPGLNSLMKRTTWREVPVRAPRLQPGVPTDSKSAVDYPYGDPIHCYLNRLGTS